MNILTLSSVFPSKELPFYGLFVFERMKHAARKEFVYVVSPFPWSPFDWIVRFFKKQFRPVQKGVEVRENLTIEYLRFFCLPGLFKFLDGYFYYRSILKPIKEIIEKHHIDIIDVHFAYPDGFAAMLLTWKFRLPFCVTLRGTEVPYARSFYRRWQMKWVFQKADRIISVSRSLADVALGLGADPGKIKVIPNGINTDIFYPRSRSDSRAGLGISENSKAILSVGGLVKRKGFHRIIQQLPELRKSFSDLQFLIVGGSSVEGDYSRELKSLVKELGLEDMVRFEGLQPPEKLPFYYSAADVFVLATANEGWPNVIVESLACGTPVVATDVGGVKEIIAHDDLGYTVPFDHSEALNVMMKKALEHRWDNQKIAAYALQRSWDNVADEVVQTFREILEEK